MSSSSSAALLPLLLGLVLLFASVAHAQDDVEVDMPVETPEAAVASAPAPEMMKCGDTFLRWKQPVCFGNKPVYTSVRKNSVVRLRTEIRVQYMTFNVSLSLMNVNEERKKMYIWAFNVRIGGKGNFTLLPEPSSDVSVRFPHKISNLPVPDGRPDCCSPESRFPLSVNVRYYNNRKKNVGRILVNGFVGTPCRHVCKLAGYPSTGTVVQMSDTVKCTHCRAPSMDTDMPAPPMDMGR